MRILSPFFLCATFFAATFPLHAVQRGDSRESVIAEMGTPSSEVLKGSATYLSYPRAEIEFLDGRVNAIVLFSDSELLKLAAITDETERALQRRLILLRLQRKQAVTRARNLQMAQGRIAEAERRIADQQDGWLSPNDPYYELYGPSVRPK